ncbi:MAG: diaminopimelate epimerase [Alphaproteobacteria bacterium]|nr:diaminopimelate epimerase [Alphaproteobacteria bacterium]
MNRRFDKMHGLGNDFVIFDGRAEPLEINEARARAIADRHTGIGCDQLILLEPSASADVRMRIFNPDGGEVDACGNAARCVALLVGGDPTIETAGGLIASDTSSGEAVIDMGKPRFGWDDIPLAYAMETSAMPVSWEDLPQPFAVNVGNPHVVFFVEDASAVDAARLGPLIERDPLFPQRVNVNFASIEPGAVKLVVWERGAGLTRACGTGACATAVAAIRRKLVQGPVPVHLPGGTLVIEWSPGNSISMRGPAAHVYSGEIDIEGLA